MNDRIHVVAGNYDQFLKYKRNYKKEAQLVNVSSVAVLEGLTEVHGVFYGTFRNRDDIREIVRKIRVINGLGPGVQLIPDLYVGRGMIPNACIPYSNHVFVHCGGVQTNNFIAVKSGDAVMVELHSAPPMGVTVSVITLKGTVMNFLGDGVSDRFTFYEATIP